jgi:hypothetical protein
MVAPTEVIASSVAQHIDTILLVLTDNATPPDIDGAIALTAEPEVGDHSAGVVESRRMWKEYFWQWYQCSAWIS